MSKRSKKGDANPSRAIPAAARGAPGAAGARDAVQHDAYVRVCMGCPGGPSLYASYAADAPPAVEVVGWPCVGGCGAHATVEVHYNGVSKKYRQYDEHKPFPQTVDALIERVERDPAYRIATGR